MGDLRDQLKKAKLLSEKEAKRIAHEQRLHRAEVGREGVEAEQRARADELAQIREEERQRTVLASEQLELQRKHEAELAACVEILANEIISLRPGGGSKWYFALADGALPWLELNESERRQLSAGAYAVIRVGPPGTHHYGLLAMNLAKRIHGAMPDRIAWAPRGVLR